jgi:hypothetical protein
MSDISQILRNDARIILLDSIKTTHAERAELENLRIAAINTARICNVSYNSSEVAKLSQNIFDSIPAAERGALSNLDSYINARVSADGENLNSAGARNLPIQLKFAIYIYGAIQLKKPDYKTNRVIQEVAFNASVFYQINNAGEAQRQEIIRFAYNTYLEIAKNMLLADDTNPENVSKVLFFALHGEKASSRAEIAEVGRITGFNAFAGYPGVTDDNSAEIRRGADAIYLLNQILDLLTSAGDDAILRSTRGLGVKNIQANNNIINMDADRRLDAADIHANTGNLAALTPQVNRNWENVSPGVNPGAAQAALAYYQRAEQLTANLRKVNLTPTAVTSDELSAKINNLFNEIKTFFTSVGLGTDGQTATYAKISESRSQLDVQLSALGRLKNSAYLNLFNDYYGNSGPAAAALKTALATAERALNITGTPPAATVSERWEKILEAKKAALAAAETEKLSRAENEKTAALASLREAQAKFNNAAAVYRDDVGLPNTALSAAAAGNAANSYPDLGDLLDKAKTAAEKAGLNITSILNNTGLNDSQKAEKIATSVLEDAERRKKETTTAAEQLRTAQQQQQTAAAAREAAVKNADNLTGLQTQAGLAKTARGLAETAARAAEEAALRARSNVTEAARVNRNTPYTAGDPPVKADEHAQAARRAAAAAKTAEDEITALINKAQNAGDLQTAITDFRQAANIFNNIGETDDGATASAAAAATETARGADMASYADKLDEALNKAGEAWRSTKEFSGDNLDNALAGDIRNYSRLNDAQKIKTIAERVLQQAKNRESVIQETRRQAEADKEKNIETLTRAKDSLKKALDIYDALQLSHAPGDTEAAQRLRSLPEETKEAHDAVASAADRSAYTPENFFGKLETALKETEEAAAVAGINPAKDIPGYSDLNDVAKTAAAAAKIWQEAQNSVTPALDTARADFTAAARVFAELPDQDARQKAGNAAAAANLGANDPDSKPLNSHNLNSALQTAREAAGASGLPAEEINNILNNSESSSAEKIQQLAQAVKTHADRRTQAVQTAKTKKSETITARDQAQTARNDISVRTRENKLEETIQLAQTADKAALTAETAAGNTPAAQRTAGPDNPTALWAAELADTTAARTQYDQAQTAAEDARKAANEAANEAKSLAEKQLEEQGIDRPYIPRDVSALQAAELILDSIRQQQQREQDRKLQGIDRRPGGNSPLNLKPGSRNINEEAMH